MASVQLRPGSDAERRAEDELTPLQRVTLLELVDRVLDKGVVISGDITLSVANVDLVYVGLRALLASVASLEREATPLDADENAGGAKRADAPSLRDN